MNLSCSTETSVSSDLPAGSWAKEGFHNMGVLGKHLLGALTEPLVEDAPAEEVAPAPRSERVVVSSTGVWHRR